MEIWSTLNKDKNTSSPRKNGPGKKTPKCFAAQWIFCPFICMHNIASYQRGPGAAAPHLPACSPSKVYPALINSHFTFLILLFLNSFQRKKEPQIHWQHLQAFITFLNGHWFHMWFANIFFYCMHTWESLTWSCHMILFATILLRMFTCKFSRHIGLYFPWVCMSFVCFWQNNTSLMEWIAEYSLFSYFL